MDGNYYQNQNDTQNQQNNTGSNRQDYVDSNYQDNTANIPYQVSPQNNQPDNKVNGLQVAGLVCGILAICGCWCYGIFSIILGIAGLVCAIMGNKQSKNGVGIGGLVCTIIGLVLGVASLIYFIYVFAYLLSDAGAMDMRMMMEYWDSL